jgi:hypothetical protein
MSDSVLKWVKAALLNGLLMVAGLAFGGLAGEAMTRIFAPQLLYRYPRGLYIAHATRHYQLAPEFRGRLTTPDYDVRVNTNSLGLREDREFGKKPAGTFRILVLGDSFTMGVGVEADQTYASVLEHILNSMGSRTRFEVINTGVPSYSTREEALYLAQEGLKLEPDLVLVGFFIGNDVEDNARERDETVVDGELVGTIAPRGVLPIGIRSFLARHSQLYHLLWPYQRKLQQLFTHDQDAASGPASGPLLLYSDPSAPPMIQEWRALDESVGHLVETARSHRIPVAAIIIPDPLQIDTVAWRAAASSAGISEDRRREPIGRVASIFQQHGVPSLDLFDFLDGSMSFRLDRHWKPENHRRAGAAIATFLRAENLIPSGN